jgi:hypothetical protein
MAIRSIVSSALLTSKMSMMLTKRSNAPNSSSNKRPTFRFGRCAPILSAWKSQNSDRDPVLGYPAGDKLAPRLISLTPDSISSERMLTAFLRRFGSSKYLLTIDA